MADLDNIKSSTAVTDYGIDVILPIAEQHTQIAGESLEFIPPADEIAFAIYRIDPPGPPLTLSATGDGSLWLLAADYGAGKWIMEPFVDGYAEIDLNLITGLYSTDGYMYSAVICPGGEAGRLDSMILAYNEFEWGLTISADDESITLNWNELDADSYEVYRSTLADDEAPYLVGTVIEEHTGGNSFTETVPADELDRWVPADNDNGTPDDPADDFPTIAPMVHYYYRLVPVVDGHRYAPSPEVSAKVGWGERRAARRAWPDTTDQTLLYGRAMDGGRMSAAQLQWCAQNMIGASGLLQSELDEIRAINPNFICLNAHHAAMSSANYQNTTTYRHDDNGEWVQFLAQFYGDEEDVDGAFPYLDNHESWFIHEETSEKYNQRCTNGWDENEDYYAFCYWMDLDGNWPAYVDANLRQLLGEDCYDGWELDGAHSNWGVYPPFYEPQGYEYLYDYLYPRLTGLFTTCSSGAAPHPLQPYIFAETYRGWTYQSSGSGPPAFDASTCDGIMVSNFLDDSRQPANRIWEFTETMGDMVLGWQSDAKPVILQCISRGSDFDHTSMVEYCCYLLIRGPQTYFYSTLNPQFSSAVYDNPYWYPMYTWDSGAPLGPQPESMQDLRVASDDLEGNPLGTYYYRRDFENGSVVVIPEAAFEHWDSGVVYEYLDVSGGGAVDADGNTTGTATWTPLSPSGVPGYLIEFASAWIMRPVAE